MDLERDRPMRSYVPAPPPTSEVASFHDVKQPVARIARNLSPGHASRGRGGSMRATFSSFRAFSIRPFSLSSLRSHTRYSLLSVRHPDEGWRSAGGARVVRAPGIRVVHVQDARERACDRRGGAVLSAPDVLKSQAREARTPRLSALRRGDFWPEPVLAVVRQSLRDRASTSYDARVIVTRRTRSRASRGGLQPQA